jgi:hypothetical protein
VKRRLFNILAGLSLLLATAFAIMGVLSLFVAFGVAHNSLRYRVALIAMPLSLDIDELHGPAAAVAVHPHGAHRPSAWMRPLGGLLPPLPQLFDWRLALMPHVRISRYLGVTAVEFSLPFWLLSAGSGLTGLMIWRSRAREQSVGRCRSCGYDLRATPDRCPECGTIPIKTAEAHS